MFPFCLQLVGWSFPVVSKIRHGLCIELEKSVLGFNSVYSRGSIRIRPQVLLHKHVKWKMYIKYPLFYNSQFSSTSSNMTWAYHISWPRVENHVLSLRRVKTIFTSFQGFCSCWITEQRNTFREKLYLPCYLPNTGSHRLPSVLAE